MNPKHFLPTLVFFGVIVIALPKLVVGVKLASVVTPKFFNGILNQASTGCKGKHFYTRTAFLNAAKWFPEFGNDATDVASKREIAAFFAHVTQETGHFCDIEEISKARYCDSGCPKYKCKAGKSYYGRGPFQIKWNCKYGAAGKYLGLDLVNHPELIATNATVSFKTALWYWKTRVAPVLIKGFGVTIGVIDGGTCDVWRSYHVRNKIKYYKLYCKQFGVSPGPNLSC